MASASWGRQGYLLPKCPFGIPAPHHRQPKPPISKRGDLTSFPLQKYLLTSMESVYKLLIRFKKKWVQHSGWTTWKEQWMLILWESTTRVHSFGIAFLGVMRKADGSLFYERQQRRCSSTWNSTNKFIWV